MRAFYYNLFLISFVNNDIWAFTNTDHPINKCYKVHLITSKYYKCYKYYVNKIFYFFDYFFFKWNYLNNSFNDKFCLIIWLLINLLLTNINSI